MENKKIKIHQAYYGEKNRSHSCIKKTFSDPDLNSFLIAFTDRPAALPPGVTLSPYLSGCAFSNYYAFSKTFPDSSATRAGMVFTHVLIFKLEDLPRVNVLQDIFSLFVRSVDQKENQLTDLELDVSKPIPKFEKKWQPQYVQEIISSYMKGVKPILFSGDLETFSFGLQQIWNSPHSASRKNLKFRTSFTPADIINDANLTIVSIQKDFLPKWYGQTIISSENKDQVEITSYSEALFLGDREENPFYEFLKELDVNFTSFQDYSSFETIFNDYALLGSTDDENQVRQNIRSLSKLSHLPEKGKLIKEKFITRLSQIIQNKKDANIKALRNIDWSAFQQGEKKAEEIVAQFIKREFESPKLDQLQTISELINISVDEETSNWWHTSIINSIISLFKTQNKTVLQNIWKAIDFSVKTLNNLLSIIEKVNNTDDILRSSIPKNLRAETLEIFIPLARNKNWYLLHADILLRKYSPEISLQKQLEIEKNLTLTDSLGVKYVAEKISPQNLKLLTLKLCDQKLISLLIDLINKDISLLKDIDLTQSCWTEIWFPIVLNSGNIFDGLAGKEKATTFSLLTLILDGKNVDNRILNLIAETPFSDISDFPERSRIWFFLENPIREKFITSTIERIFNEFIDGLISPNSIEIELIEKIISDRFMTDFLNKNRNNIQPVIKVYESFPKLKDQFLADYISYYPNSITLEQSKKLGHLVLKNNFTRSARSLYDKSTYYNSFKPASEICLSLVDFNWVESLWGSVGDFFGSSERVYPIQVPILDSNESSTKKDMNIINLPTVVILTAIKEEYSAVREHLTQIYDADRNDTFYEAGIFEFNNKKIAKVIIRECGAKNANAALETERAIHYFKPDLMLFVGIAGSRKPNDFIIGDVIFPEKVYSYEGGKSGKNSFLARPDTALMTYTLKETAKKVRLKNDWKVFIKGDWEEVTRVKADLGNIASGEVLIEHYESYIGKILTKHYNDTHAVEMEGFGFGNAANQQGRETSKILIGVVRGISDVIEQPKEKGSIVIMDRRPIYAKQLASATAAGFAFCLIFTTFEK